MAQTYHCICTALVLATTFPLSHRRALDCSIILPCPTPSPQVAALAGQTQANISEANAEQHAEDDETTDTPSPSMTLLLSTVPSSSLAPLLIRSDEGIEKRYPLQCSRCRLMLGYQLDWDQFGAGIKTEEGAEGGGRGGGSGQTGRREDVVYLLEGAVMSTEDMRKG